MDVAQCEKKQRENIRNRFSTGACYVKGDENRKKNRTIYRFISETIQYMVIVTMEDE